MTAAVPTPARQVAYDAVYRLIDSIRTQMPPDLVHRNALIWRAVETALDAMDESGRLLPSGGEEQYRIVWTGESGVVFVEELDDDEDPQQRLRDFRDLGSPVAEAHLEHRHVTDWSPVVSDSTEGESSG